MRVVKRTEKYFGEVVRELRETLGLTIAELAERSKLTAAAISQIETGHRDPQLRSVIKIASALGVKVSRLLEEPVEAARKAQ